MGDGPCRRKPDLRLNPSTLRTAGVFCYSSAGMRRFPEKKVGRLILRWRRLKAKKPKSWEGKGRRTARLAKWERHFIRACQPLFLSVAEHFKENDPRCNGATVREMVDRMNLRARKWFRRVGETAVQEEKVHSFLSICALSSCINTIPVDGRILPKIRAQIRAQSKIEY